MKTNQNPQSKMASTDFQCPIIDACATGAHIEELCKAGGYTPTMLCAALGLSATQSIYHWYRGRCLLSLDNLYALARLMHVHMDDFLVEAA